MADNSDTTSMNLSNDITVNGRTFKKGQRVDVPKAQADDIARMDFEHNEYLKNLHTKRSAITNMGSQSVGGS